MTAGRERAIERDLYVMVVLPSGEKPGYKFRVRWRKDGERHVSGELREPSGEVAGRIATTWRSAVTDTLRPVTGAIRWLASPLADRAGPLADVAGGLAGMVGDLDPPTSLEELVLDIDDIDAAGIRRSLHVSSRVTRDGTKINEWVIRGAPADWWTRVTVFRDGVPTPIDFGQA